MPPALSLVSMLMLRPISASEERIVARTVTVLPLPAWTLSAPKRFSTVTRPPRYVSERLNVFSKRSSARAPVVMISATAMAIASLAALMRFLPQHVLERALLRGVDRQELPAQLRVLAIRADGGPAVGDGVVEKHQFFLVRDHERRHRLLEPRLGELLHAVDRRDVVALRALDLVERTPLQNGLIELVLAHAALRVPAERGQRREDGHGRGELPELEPLAAMFGVDGALDARQQRVARPRRVHRPRGRGDLVELVVVSVHVSTSPGAVSWSRKGSTSSWPR